MSPFRIRALAASAVLVAGALSAPPRAAEGRIPIFAPTTISADGKYIVTRNISSPTSPAITVASPNVDIDLNGFILDEAGAVFPCISVGGVESVTVRNGTLRGGTAGIEVAPGVSRVVVEDLKIQSPLGFGIHLVNPLSVGLRRNIINAPTGTGIALDPGPVQPSGTIEGNVIRDGASMGIFVNSASALSILNNRIESVAGTGIELDASEGCLVSENTVERVQTTGINLANSSGNKLYDNVVRGVKFHGIHVDAASASNLVVMNSATGNGAGLPGGHGLFIEGSKNMFERNILNDNNGAGLRFAVGSASNTFAKNTARGNVGVALGPCAAGLFPPNSCNDGAASNSTFGDNLIPGPPVF